MSFTKSRSALSIRQNGSSSLSSLVKDYTPGIGDFIPGRGGLGGASHQQIGANLRTDLGIGLSDVIARGLIEVGEDPRDAFKNFVGARAHSEKAAGKRFEDALDLAASLGLPEGDAVNWAKEQAKDALAADLQLLRLRYPFSNDAEHMQQFKKTGHIAVKKDSA